MNPGNNPHVPSVAKALMIPALGGTAKSRALPKAVYEMASCDPADRASHSAQVSVGERAGIIP